MNRYDEQTHAEYLAEKVLGGDSIGVLGTHSCLPTYFDLADILEHYDPEVCEWKAVNDWIDCNWDEILRCEQYEAEEVRAELYAA